MLQQNFRVLLATIKFIPLIFFIHAIMRISLTSSVEYFYIDVWQCMRDKLRMNKHGERVFSFLRAHVKVYSFAFNLFGIHCRTATRIMPNTAEYWLNLMQRQWNKLPSSFYCLFQLSPLHNNEIWKLRNYEIQQRSRNYLLFKILRLVLPPWRSFP